MNILTLGDETNIKCDWVSQDKTIIYDDLDNEIITLYFQTVQALNDFNEQLLTFDKYEFIEMLFGQFYDFDCDLQTLIYTYCEDIVLGWGEEATFYEVGEIKKDLIELTQQDFCKKYKIYKIGEIYFRI